MPRTDFDVLARQLRALAGLEESVELELRPVAPGRAAAVSAPAGPDAKDWTATNKRVLPPFAQPDRPPFPYPDMGDWTHLAGFVAWARENFPARRYLLLVSGHGRGWRGLSPDDENGSELAVAGLADALSVAGSVDVYASDACRMQTAEVLRELKGKASVAIGSEETVPNKGFDYISLVRALSAKPAASPEEVGQSVVKAYGLRYSRVEYRVALSAARLSGLDSVAGRLDSWVDAVMHAGEVEPLAPGHRLLASPSANGRMGKFSPGNSRQFRLYL